MRTDSIFYQLFQLLPGALFDLIGQPHELAYSYRFTSVEVKELARTMDGLFLPLEESSQHPIYFVEVQFQKDAGFYWRVVTEIFVYLGQYKPKQDWQAIAVWARRSLEPEMPRVYQDLVASGRIRRIYLDELGETRSIGVGIIQLVVGTNKKAPQQVRELMAQAQQQVADESLRRGVIELIERVVIYKFPHKSAKELEKMFGLSEWKKTRFYQEVKAEGKVEGKVEGKLETVPRLLKLGLSLEQIADALELSLEQVRRAAPDPSSN
jgi:predicted transposase/invertase (TIGR01784 family)